jgi:hypothetical protein
MNFEEFQNQSRFYVVGALEPGDVEEFERERKKFGKKAEDFVTHMPEGAAAVALKSRTIRPISILSGMTKPSPVAAPLRRMLGRKGVKQTI